ncbi:ATP-dependent zinc protease [Kordiimonas sp.]|uniref:ATP-dependent zinc protease family protein n=1 Tax=Kordiimonas sp. TaxID=1970157 RepID=UPI003A93165B
MKSKLIVGWREWAGLPEFSIANIKAKIDTGAKTSALHAYRIKKVMRDGAPWAEFFVHPVQRHRKPEIKCAAPIVGEREIKSSNGVVQKRLVVSTPLVLGPFVQKIELTLTNRDEMGFRLLVGRQALAKRYLVDSGLSYGLGEPDDDRWQQ